MKNAGYNYFVLSEYQRQIPCINFIYMSEIDCSNYIIHAEYI